MLYATYTVCVVCQAWVELDFGGRLVQTIFGCPDLRHDPSACTAGDTYALAPPCELATHEMQHVTHAMQEATVEHCMQHRTMHAREVVGRPPHAVHGLFYGVAHRTLHAGAQFIVAHCMCVHLHACMWARACVRACLCD
jgi:hypothetical protein